LFSTTSIIKSDKENFSDNNNNQALNIDSFIMPSPPYLYRSSQAPTLDLSDLGSKISDADLKRRDAYDVSRKLQIEINQIRNDMESESTSLSLEKRNEAVAKVQADLVEAIGTTSTDRTPREANLSNRVEDTCRLLAFVHFLETGGWLPPSHCSSFGCTDEEYLAGACMGLCKELERYALGRATARDVDSVVLARNLVNEILDYLMQFDFRNGYLRRKYDGTKYALKTLETLLYELSVTGATVTNGDESVEEPQAKKTKLDDSSQTAKPQDELDAIRKRMEHRDELREKLIKKCRDGQKAAKQAIYALHRKDNQKALKLIHQCEECVQTELLPIVDEEPPLRSGSFANVLEEYAEAKLFYVWLLGEGESHPKGTLLLPQDFSLSLEPDEYLGGKFDYETSRQKMDLHSKLF
jgi:predicted translin family RNA/ssDNA-binding protein